MLRFRNYMTTRAESERDRHVLGVEATRLKVRRTGLIPVIFEVGEGVLT